MVRMVVVLGEQGTPKQFTRKDLLIEVGSVLNICVKVLPAFNELRCG